MANFTGALDGALDFLARHKDAALWFQSIGSIAGLVAAYYFGSLERNSKQRAHGMTAWTVTRDAQLALGRWVFLIKYEFEETVEFVERANLQFSRFSECSDTLMAFPLHEMRAKTFVEFSDYRQLVRNVRTTGDTILSGIHNDSSRDIAEIVRDSVITEEYFYRFRKTLGRDNARMSDRDQGPEEALRYYWDRIRLGREIDLPLLPAGDSELAHIRRMNRRSGLKHSDLKRRDEVHFHADRFAMRPGSVAPSPG